MKTKRIDCNIDGYGGYILLRVPSFEERWGLRAEVGQLPPDLFKMANAEAEKTPEEMAAMMAVVSPFIVKIVSLARPFIHEVAITTPAGETLKTFDEVASEPDLDPLLIAVGLRNALDMKDGSQAKEEERKNG